MPFLPCSPAPSSAYRVLLPRWILLVMSFLPSARLISPMCLVDCTSSISCLPSVHVCVCLFLPPLTITTSLFVELMVRDRPFNLKGWGGYGFLFRSEIFLRTTQELEYFFFLSCKAQFFFPEFNIRLYDKNSESDYYFFPPPKSEYFFSNIGNQNIFLEKKHNPPAS